MRALIIGGGVAGTATALALDKAGVDVTVYEAHPATSGDIGAFLTLAGNGMLALGQLAAAERVAAVGFPLTSMRVVDHRGTVAKEAPLDGHEQPLTAYRCLRRSELCAALQDEVRSRGIQVVHGKRLTGFAEGAESVTAEFADGTTVTGDLLVGADGLGSVVRSRLDPDAATPRYVGQRVFYGYADRAPVPAEPERIEMVRARNAAVGYAVSPVGQVYWFARVHGPELAEDEIAVATPARWRDQLMALLRGDPTPAADVVAATGDRLMVTNAYDLPSVPRWHGGRVLVVGDAAHAASPATGQGASMALEDAVVLGKAVRDAETVDAALAAYEQVRRPRVEENVAASARLSARRPSKLKRAVDQVRSKSRPRPNQAGPDVRWQLDWATPLRYDPYADAYQG